MSNKPKVYGTCDAGCRWQVPHMSDLERSAAYIKQNHALTDATLGYGYALEAGKTYLLTLPTSTSGVPQYGRMKLTWYVEYPAPEGLEPAKSWHSPQEVMFVGAKALELVGMPVETIFHVHGVRLRDDVFELVYEEDGEIKVTSLISNDLWGLNLNGDEKFVIDSISVYGVTGCLLYNRAVQSVIDPEKVGDGLTVDEYGVLRVNAFEPAEVGSTTITDGKAVATITKDKIFYPIHNSTGLDIDIVIDCDVDSLPNGYVGFITVTGADGTLTSDKLKETSVNGKTLAEVNFQPCALLMVSKPYGGTKLAWYYFC